MKNFLSNNMLCILVVFALFVPSAPEASEKVLFTKHFQKTLFDVTAHAAYSVEILLDDSEYKKLGKNVVGIVIHDAHDSDVEKAELSIAHRNLLTSEKAPGVVEIREKGDGLYIVSGLDLMREGKWELLVTVKKNGVEDSVKFLFPDALKERVAKGRYSP
jgi:hypothetical protein